MCIDELIISKLTKINFEQQDADQEFVKYSVNEKGNLKISVASEFDGGEIINIIVYGSEGFTYFKYAGYHTISFEDTIHVKDNLK